MPLRKYGLVFVALLGTCAAQAQSFFEHLTRADGLPSDQILALHEDRNGFVWIGTESGLARHEGVRIRTWLHDRKDPHSLPNNVIWDITTDENGHVWVATDHGLGRYDERTGGFNRVFITDAYHDPTSANRVHRIAADGYGRLWLSTEDGIHVIALGDKPLPSPLPGDGPRIKRLTDRVKAFGLQVDKLRDGLWVNGSNGLLFFDQERGEWITTSTDPSFACLSDTLAQDALPDGTGGVWYFTSGTKELLHADARGAITARERITSATHDLVNPQFIRLGRDGTLWLSTWSHELRSYHPGTRKWETFTHQDAEPWSITSSNTKSWLQDRDGRIWLGTFAGLNVIDPAHKDVSPYRIGQGDEWIGCIRALDAQRVLVGTSNGLFVLDRSSGEQRVLSFVDSASEALYIPYANNIRNLTRISDGFLVGTLDGLLHLDSALTKLSRPSAIISQQPRLGRGTVSFVQHDGRGNLWIGKTKGGLSKMNAAGQVALFDSVSPTPLHTRQLLSCATGENGTWVGSNNGGGAFLVRNDSIVQRILHEAGPDGASYGVVLSLALDENGTLYIGTLMGGLGLLAHGASDIKWYTRSDGLTGDRVEALLVDDGNGLWVGTNDGLCRFDRSTHAIERVNIPASLRSDGRFSAMALDEDGSLLCAYGSLLMDLPATAARATDGPDVVLTALRSGDRTLSAWDPDSLVDLKHDARAISLEFGARTFFSDRAVRFAYRVIDLDSAWRNLGSSSRLELNDLPVGRHRVEVRANDGGSVWTKRPLVLHVRVLPPWWSTWWFRIGATLLVALLAWAGVRYYVQERLAEQKAAYEREQAVLKERMRIAGDMHDDLGAGLSGLKLRSEMALRVEKDPAKREQLGNLANTAGELIGSMRQIIWTMNADQAGVEDLAVYTTSYARNYCQENGLGIDVQQMGPWPSLLLTTEQRRNVFLVVKEALHNTVKHARAEHVRLKIHWDEGLAVEVGDDGIGLSQGADKATGNGLRNMERRIRALGGTFTIEAGQGTRIRFHVPLRESPRNQGSIASNVRG